MCCQRQLQSAPSLNLNALLDQMNSEASTLRYNRISKGLQSLLLFCILCPAEPSGHRRLGQLQPGLQGVIHHIAGSHLTQGPAIPEKSAARLVHIEEDALSMHLSSLAKCSTDIAS